MSSVVWSVLRMAATGLLAVWALSLVGLAVLVAWAGLKEWRA